MSNAADILAKEEQRNHSETDDRTGIVEAYLDTMLPTDWDKLDVFERRQFLAPQELSAKKAGTVERDYVCVAEVWCECLEKEKKDMDRYKTRDLNDILRGLEGWEQSKSTKNFGIYGKQKYYTRRL